MGRRLGSSEDETIGVIIHICMETIHAISLCSYLYHTLAKRAWFSYYLLCIFFYKIREQEDRTGLHGAKGWHKWEEGSGMESGRVNTVQIMCKCKNDTR
jgi:hypothetical protein